VCLIVYNDVNYVKDVIEGGLMQKADFFLPGIIMLAIVDKLIVWPFFDKYNIHIKQGFFDCRKVTFSVMQFVGRNNEF